MESLRSILFDVAGYLGVSSRVGERIVDAIDWGGTAFMVASLISSLASAGLLSTASIAADIVIFKVKSYLSRNLKAQAIVW
jgi:circularin A/uberolysin family circular bacteriocin